MIRVFTFFIILVSIAITSSYARLIEGFAHCHAMYAKDKFPGFGPAKEQGHRH